MMGAVPARFRRRAKKLFRVSDLVYRRSHRDWDRGQGDGDRKLWSVLRRWAYTFEFRSFEVEDNAFAWLDKLTAKQALRVLDERNPNK